MDQIIRLFQDAAAVAKGDQKAMERLLKDKQALRMGLLMMGLAVAAVAFGGFFFPRHVSEVLVYRLGFWDALQSFLSNTVLAMVMLYAVAWLAAFFSDDEWEMTQIVGVLGHMWIVHLMALIPILAFISAPWYLYLEFTFLYKVLKLKPVEVAGAMLIPIVLHWALFSDVTQMLF